MAHANAFSVDVEEWFHVCGVGALGPAHWDTLPSRVVATTRLLLEEFDRTGVRGTFFVLGWVAERYPSLVQEILAAGHEVGSHGHLHVHVYELGSDAFVSDLRQSIAALRAAGVERLAGYRAPEWSINDRSLWALEALVREGVPLDASMAPLRLVGRVDYPRRPHRRDTAAGSILEIPPLVADRFGQVMPLGWGWGLRMSSPQRVLRSVEAMNRAGSPAVFDVHPWEIDPDPPRMPLPLRQHFAHYFCLAGFRQRLMTILSGADFGTLSDLPAVQGLS
jgi:polysaccharide deacetylase family protein (PEP-CTERM system associated)